MANKTYKFIVSDENVNHYGYRVLTDGIDTEQYMRNPVVLFMHKRKTYDPTGDEVIGKCVKLYKEGTQLVADIEFDEENEFAKKIAGKVERGFIRMCSLGADPIALSSAPEDVIEGQTMETVTKCIMEEISIVDMGGNDRSLIRLSKNGKPVQLNKLEFENKQDMSIQKIALAMGLDSNSDATAVETAVKAIVLAKNNAVKERDELKVQLNKIHDEVAKTMTAKAIELGLIDKGLEAIQLGAFKQDHEGTKVALSKLIKEKQAELAQDGKSQAVRDVVLGKSGKSSAGTDDEKESFDYLQKHDPVKLGKIRDEQPEKYVALAKAYEQGVRYKG